MIHTPWHWGRSDDRFAPDRVLAYDSEFVRERHYYPKLSLIQVADQYGQAHLYDVTHPEHAPPWQALFQQHAPIVLHAGGQDLELMQQYAGYLPCSIRDTQIGFALLYPEPAVSFSALVEHYLGFTPNKTQTRSDWLQRPLLTEQLDYAANDVGFLQRIYPLMVAEMQQKTRLSWWAEECQRMLQNSHSETPFHWYHLRFAPQLRGKAIIIADILTQAREKVAQLHDQPRRLVLPDKILFDLANTGIDQIEVLAEWLPPEHLLWQALPFLESAFASWQHHKPVAIPRAPKLNHRQQQFCQRLQRIIIKQANELGIHPNTIITPKQLRQWCSESAYEKGLLQEGWRSQYFQSVINALAP